MSQRCTAHVVLWESLKPWALGRAASAYPASSNWPHTASLHCKGRDTCMDPQYLMQEHGARRVLQLGCTPAFLCAGAAGFGVGMMFWAGFMLGGIFIPRIDFKTNKLLLSYPSGGALSPCCNSVILILHFFACYSLFLLAGVWCRHFWDFLISRSGRAM